MVKPLWDSWILVWQHRRTLLKTALIHRLLGVILLWPILGWLMSRWLLLTGQVAVTDDAIARFLLTPSGIIGGLICLTVGLCIAALEQSSLIVQSCAARHRKTIRTPLAIQISVRRFRDTLPLVLRITLSAIVLVLPFLAAAAGLAWWLLHEHDINYYLAQRPAEFFWAIGGCLLILGIGLFVALPFFSRWSVALPVLMIQGGSARQAIAMSRSILHRRHWPVASAWLVWLLIQLLLTFLFASAVYWTARMTIALAFNWLPVLVPLLGVFALIWFLGNLILSLLQGVSFAALGVTLFESLAADGERLAKSPASSDRSDSSAPSDSLISLIDLQTMLQSCSQPSYADALSPASSNHPRPDIAADSQTRNWLAVASLVAFGAIAGGLWLLLSLKAREDAIVIAHRGASAVAPDNTIAAFEKAIEARADWIELDVQETADGQVIVFHDSDFMKLAGNPVKVWEADYPTLNQIDIGSRFDVAFADQRAPLLVDVLRLCRDRIPVIIELKYYGHNQKLVERVVEIVEQEQMADQIVLMSLKHELVVAAKRLRPDWTVGFLAAVAVGDLTRMEGDFLAVNTKLATRSFIKRAHARNKPVYVWTIDDPATMSFFISLGVDGIITNRPDLARQSIEYLRELSVAERFLLDAAIRIGVVPFKIRVHTDDS